MIIKNKEYRFNELQLWDFYDPKIFCKIILEKSKTLDKPLITPIFDDKTETFDFMIFGKEKIKFNIFNWIKNRFVNLFNNKYEK